MLKALITTVFLLLSCCAQRIEVHVFSEAIEQYQINTAIEVLETRGFKATPNPLPVPAQIIRHTLIMPAIVEDISIIDSLKDELEATGFNNVKLVYQSEGNHSYSTENIGLYLVNPESRSTFGTGSIDPSALSGIDGTKLTHIYYSECENTDTDSELNLYPGGIAVLERFEWKDISAAEQSVFYDGTWQVAGDTLELDLYDHLSLQFIIKERTGKNRFGSYTGITLLNQHAATRFTECDYSYVIYD